MVRDVLMMKECNSNAVLTSWSGAYDSVNAS